MVKTNKKSLMFGAVLAASFFGVLLLIFSPIFGDGRNGLTYADEMFNTPSKGSSYFIPELQKHAEKFNGQALSVKISAAKPRPPWRALRRALSFPPPATRRSTRDNPRPPAPPGGRRRTGKETRP